MVDKTGLANRCLTQLIWHNMDRRDDVKVFTRSLKLGLESSVMPKSLTEGTGVSSWSRKGTLMSDTLLRSCHVPKKKWVWFCLDLSVIDVSNTTQQWDVGLL